MTAPGDGAGVGGAADAATASGMGADGEPVQPTITGADAKLEGRDPPEPREPGAPPAEPPETAEPTDVPTPANPDLVGGAANWKSGQPAARVTPARTDGPQLAAPARDGLAHRYELRAYGTRIEVYMDGQPIPADRVAMAGNQVGVLDAKSGAVIERLDLPPGWTEDAQKAAAPDPTDPYDFRDIHGARLVPIKVMLGGRLVSPTPAVLKHMSDRGVKRDRASMITNVIPDLPLAKAGLENDDIVVAVNEVPDADPESIRAVLRMMKPGESLALRVVRGTETIDAQVTVAAWEAKHMVRAMGTGGTAKTEAPRAPSAGPAAAAAPAAATAPSEAAASSAAMKASMASVQAAVAKLDAELAAARARIATLEKQLSDNDPVRRAIRPAPTPPPAVAPPQAPASRTAPQTAR